MDSTDILDELEAEIQRDFDEKMQALKILRGVRNDGVSLPGVGGGG